MTQQSQPSPLLPPELQELEREIKAQSTIILSRIREYERTTKEDNPTVKFTAMFVTELSLLTVLVRHQTRQIEEFAKYVNILKDEINDLECKLEFKTGVE